MRRRSRRGRCSSRSARRALCRSESALLALYGGVVALYAVVMVTRPEWQAINPFGPTQNSRFWGIGNQVETLLLAPLLAGAVPRAAPLRDRSGFVLFGFFGLVVMTDNRLGADGGGAIVLGVALAVLGARLFRLGVKRLRRAARVRRRSPCSGSSRAASPQRGPNHLRSAFSGHGAGTALVAREPRCRSPTCRRCTRGRSSCRSCSCSRRRSRSRGAAARQRSTRDRPARPRRRDRHLAARQRLRRVRARRAESPSSAPSPASCRLPRPRRRGSCVLVARARLRPEPRAGAERSPPG